MMKKIVFIAVVSMLAVAPSVADIWQAPDQERARKKAQRMAPFVGEYLDEGRIDRKKGLMDAGISLNDVRDVYFLLDSPVIKKREDQYKPVRFAHKRHAALADNCSQCHHLKPKEEEALETTRCSACHQEAFDEEHPERIGLKAAYHQQCMDCHKDMGKGPVDCKGCHLKHVPDHKELVKLPDKPDPFQVTAECLRCHEAQANDMLKTSHWLWKGPSPFTKGHRKEIQHGKGTTVLNNY